MQLWPGTSAAKISNGTHTGYNNLVGLKDSKGHSIEQTVAALGEDIVLSVTGHSLGGTLAPVLALKLSENEPKRAIISVSFAGLTPGNSSFADLFSPGSSFFGHTRRVFNTLDSVSYRWNNVLATRNFFEPAPKGGLIVKIFLLVSWLTLKLGRYNYTPIGEDVALTGQVKNYSSTGLIAYVLETLHQHMPDTYLQLLGAPPLPFSILFGNITVDLEDTKDQTPSNTQIPVFHL